MLNVSLGVDEFVSNMVWFILLLKDHHEPRSLTANVEMQQSENGQGEIT